ncbi:MAG TPA: sigma-70 family RNA polymerase sigma factor [Micromonosporaceae bacterium]|nr:sigma-70 family RNA polymerase sigma factor [Micromonosporaceae bacterium]
MSSATSPVSTASVRPWDAVARDFAAWQDGEAAALDRVVTVLTPVLWQLARSYGLDRETAEDVVQTTWLALVRGAGTVRDPRAVWRWTTVTTRREAWRASRTGHREAVAEVDTMDAAAPAVAGPEGAALPGRRDQTLWRRVGRLTERCRRLLRVIAFDDRPDYAALSAELGIPVGSVCPTRGRCLDKLRGMLADGRDRGDR